MPIDPELLDERAWLIRGKPEGGWPVAIYGHGLGGNRTNMLGIADTLASVGIATVATMLLAIPVAPALTTAALRMATGIDSFAHVSETVWRGAAPTTRGYAALADAGVVAVVDLRAEADPMAPARIFSA